MLKEVNSTLEYRGKSYKLVFNLNVMEAIQAEYGTVERWGELTDGKSGEVDIKALIFGITQMINEAIDIDNEDNGANDPFLTHKQVARIVSEIGTKNAAQNMNELVVESVKDDNSKNV